MGKRKSKHIQGLKGRRFIESLRGIPLEQVVIVPIDAAKHHPKALICNYFGDILEDSFFFSVNIHGIKLLTEKIQQAIINHNAKRVFIGIEATGHYHEDIVRELEKQGYEVTIINPYTTFEERASALNWSKTDDLDLAAIATAIIQNKGTESKLPLGIHDKLLAACRARRSEVKKRSALQMETRCLMDVIWREFQGIPTVVNGKPQVKPVFSDLWGKASCYFMRHYPLPNQVLALGEKGLRTLSKEQGLQLRSSTIEKLLRAAAGAITKDPADLEIELLQLQMKLDDMKRANEKIEVLEHKIERLLVQTPGVLLLSAPEIGVITAAEFTAEVGPVSQYNNAGQIIKKAGTNSMVSQTGGGEAAYGKISKQGNPHLRTVIYNIGYNLAYGTNLYFKAFAKRLKDNGKRSKQVSIAVGNKFVKVAFAMLRDKSLFQPPTWDDDLLSKDFLVKKIGDDEHRRLALETLNSLLKKNQKIVC